MNEERNERVGWVSAGVNLGALMVGALSDRKAFDVLERLGNDEAFADDVYDYVAQCSYDQANEDSEPTEDDFERMIDGVLALAGMAS